MGVVYVYSTQETFSAAASGRLGCRAGGQSVAHWCGNTRTIRIQTIDDIDGNCKKGLLDVYVLLSGSLKKLYVVVFGQSFSFFEGYNLVGKR